MSSWLLSKSIPAYTSSGRPKSCCSYCLPSAAISFMLPVTDSKSSLAPANPPENRANLCTPTLHTNVPCGKQLLIRLKRLIKNSSDLALLSSHTILSYSGISTSIHASIVSVLCFFTKRTISFLTCAGSEKPLTSILCPMISYVWRFSSALII